MTIGAALRAHILGDVNIAAIVSGRVYPLRLPQFKKDAVNLRLQRSAHSADSGWMGSRAHGLTTKVLRPPSESRYTLKTNAICSKRIFWVGRVGTRRTTSSFTKQRTERYSR